MKTLLYKTCLLFVFIACFFSAYSQSNFIDSLKTVLQAEKEDSNKVKLLNSLSYEYIQYSADTAVTYAQNALNLAEKINFEQGILYAELFLTAALMISGNYPLAVDHAFKYLSIAKNKKDAENESIANAYLGECYYALGEYTTSLKYYRENLRLAETFHMERVHFAWTNMAHVYNSLHQPDSAMLYAKKAYGNIRNSGDTLFVLNILGDAYAGRANYDSALFYYRINIAGSIRNHTLLEHIDGYNGIALVYKTIGNLDSAAWYSKKVLAERIEKNYPLGLLRAANNLADIYSKQNKPDSTLKYLRIALNIKDSLFGREKTMAIQNLAFKEQEKQKELEASELKFQNRLRTYFLLGGLVTLLAIALILLRNNQNKQKTNLLLEQQKQKVEHTLSELKSTQSQLIQKEKMASLGELTAGIAHEIQNPLNFVNNFSEVSNELLDEMKTELAIGNSQEAIMLADDVKQNLEKILHHGKRADAIVKGMLLHSQTSAGHKEPTNINTLADEYLRLSYNGLRAKDKTLPTGQAGFNVTLQTDFDETIGNINIIPQDIGRVLLNLFNNAFYATNEKQKLNAENYEPLVSVITKKTNDTIEIKVSDNGNGIPQKIVDKIFQPFFTTKPTGKGTGLGLSLSYDIVKAHGGEIKVDSKEGEGTTFKVVLSTS